MHCPLLVATSAPTTGFHVPDVESNSKILIWPRPSMAEKESSLIHEISSTEP